MKLLHLERRSGDDEIIITRSVVEVLFRRFIGRVPNLTKLNDDEILGHYYSRFYTKAPPLPAGETLNRSEGIIVRKPGAGEKTASSDDYVFSARAAVDWMLDFTSATSIDEAAEILGQFVRYGLIAFVSDKGKIKEENQEAEFRVTERAIYKVTKEGIAVAKWNEPTNNHAATASKANLHADVTPGNKIRPSHEASASVSVQRRTSLSDRFRSDFDISGVPGGDNHNKDSHTARLKQILEEPALRSLFREFLRSNFCEENLSFWLDVQDFKRRFQTTTYLAPASPCELNIDHNLRAELVAYMNQITADKEAGVKGHVEPGIGNTLHASQLQTMVKLYERIQVYIFRLMATDSVPKFLTLTQQFSEYEKDESAVAGLEAKTAALVIDSHKTTTHIDGRAPSPTRAYLTISQAANEKQAAKQKH
ncbi:hypothetical protein I352_03765 [Cryptococcus deuterogattii MMRL2647]|nr:hypothetical protein I352_03765 [Cryptococcus deuterogattii MMRL2647]